MAICTGRRHHHRVIHCGRLPPRRSVAAVAGDSGIWAALVVPWQAGRRASIVTSTTGPRRHIAMVEGCWNPGRGVVTSVTRPRCQPAFMPCRNAPYDRIIVTISAGRCRHDGVVHRRRDPGRRAVTAVTGCRGIRPAFVIRRNPC